MKTGAEALLILLFLVLVPLFCGAQCMNSTSAWSQGVPRFVKFGGVLKNATCAPLSRVVALKFVIHSDSTGGTP